MKKTSVAKVFILGLIFWKNNFFKLTKRMFFPIFGQIFGAIWVFTTTFENINNYSEVMHNFPIAAKSPMYFFVLTLIFCSPGIIILILAFIRSFTVQFELARETYRIKYNADMDSFKTFIKDNLIKFLKLILFNVLIIGVLTLFVITIPLIVIYFIYLPLILIVFALETRQNAFGVVKRSFELINHNFASTFLIIITTIVLVIACSGLIYYLFALSKLTIPMGNYLSTLLDLNAPKLMSLIPNAGNIIVDETFKIAIGYLFVPFAVCIYTHWYIELRKRFEALNSQNVSRVKIEYQHKEDNLFGV